MQPGQIQVGKVYAVWMSRKLIPVLIQSCNVQGGWNGLVWPSGKHVTIRSAKKVSTEFILQRPVTDFKSRAAGDKDE